MEGTKIIINDGDKVWVTIHSTINLGNYETFKIEAGRSQTIKKKDNPDELIEILIDELMEIVDEKGEEIKYKKNEHRKPKKPIYKNK